MCFPVCFFNYPQRDGINVSGNLTIALGFSDRRFTPAAIPVDPVVLFDYPPLLQQFAQRR